MKEIKFKYIFQNIETKELIIKIYTINDIESGQHLIYQDMEKYILFHRFRYTGLKDKNRVEIYEGDIMALNTLKPSYYIVKYENNRFILDGLSIFENSTYFEEREVIGNICENKDLLGGINSPTLL